MEFDDDPAKAARNLKKHKVSFEEAASVFGDPMAYTFADPYQFDWRRALAYVWPVPHEASARCDIYSPERKVPNNQCTSCYKA